MLSYLGKPAAARASADAAIQVAADLGELYDGLGHAGLAFAALAEGDVVTALHESEMAWQRGGIKRETVAMTLVALAAYASGDVGAARRWAGEAVSTMAGWHRIMALNVRTRIAIAEGRPDLAERDAHDAIACAAGIQVRHCAPDLLEALHGFSFHREACNRI